MAEKHPIRLIAVDNIKVDQAIQSRVKTSPDYMREFSEAMLRGDVFPLVVVFWDGKKNWLADGFHRHGAAKRAGAKDIRCEVREGTRRDAVIHSAGANKAFSIPRTTEDIRKSIRMLIEDEEWFGASDAVIAKHVGYSRGTATRWFAEYCQETGRSRPEARNTQDGRPYKPPRKGPPAVHMKRYGDGRKPRLVAYIGGKEFALGTDPSEAQSRLKDLIEVLPAAKKVPDRLSALRSFFENRGLLPGDAGLPLSSVRGLAPLSLAGRICAWTNFDKLEDLPLAVGRLLILRALRDDSPRMVVLCYRERANAAQLAAAESLGVEFLTPEELAESLK